jgi:hypothetical protein
MAAGTTLDLTDSSLVVAYTSSSPLASIQAEIAAAYDHGNWDLPGITSSDIPTHPGTALGYADNAVLQKNSFNRQGVTATSILLEYTWLGDANLDGVVDATDLAMMSSTGNTWTSGDFNYDGKVNSDDYALFMLGDAQSNGANISSTLPEPSTILVIPVLYGTLRRRRGR